MFKADSIQLSLRFLFCFLFVCFLRRSYYCPEVPVFLKFSSEFKITLLGKKKLLSRNLHFSNLVKSWLATDLMRIQNEFITF